MRQRLDPHRIVDDDVQAVGVPRQPLPDREGQLRGQHLVDLHRHDALHVRQQGESEAAESGPHFEDHVARTQMRRAHDPLDGVGVGDEVLPPLLGGSDAELGSEPSDVAPTKQGCLVRRVHHAPKTRWALSHKVPPIATSLTPRSRAIARTVHGMRYDAFGLPRCGTGVR